MKHYAASGLSKMLQRGVPSTLKSLAESLTYRLPEVKKPINYAAQVLSASLTLSYINKEKHYLPGQPARAWF